MGTESPLLSARPPLPRVLILDYHDSYTNNLLTLFARTWSDEEVQKQVVVVEADAWSWEECQAALEEVDCVVLSPGPGRPDLPEDIRYGLELIHTTQLPLLGVCLGMQALGVAYGGKIINTPQIRHGQVVRVRHTGQGVFARLPGEREGEGEGEVDVVVYNSLAVDEASLPAELRIDAWAVEEPIPSYFASTSSNNTLTPRRTIQGLSHRTRPQWGVQFHPESVSSTAGRDIVRAFIDCVWEHHGRPQEFPPIAERLIRMGTTAHPGARCDNEANSSRIASKHANPRGYGVLPGSASLQFRAQELDVHPDMDVEDVFERVFREKRWSLGEVWLDGQSPNAPTINSMAHPAFVLSYNLTRRRVTCHYTSTESGCGKQAVSGAHFELAPGTTFWKAFADLQEDVRARLGPRGESSTSSDVADRSRFVGGFVGYFGYELKAESLLGYEADPLEVGSERDGRADACWAFVDHLLERDGEGKWTARGVVKTSNQHDTASPSLLLDWLQSLHGLRLGYDESAWRDWIASLPTAFALPSKAKYDGLPAMPTFQPDIPARAYIDGIRKCREAIYDGNSYELTLSCQFKAKAPSTDTFGLYRRLRQRNPAPYSAYFNLPTLDISILSSSPERFIRISKDGEVQMKPIKGTRARIRCVCAVAGQANCAGPGGEGCPAWCEAQDAKVGKELGEDKKERAENLMIVDLIRSDLLSFCKPSSVQVPKLIALETYEKVHQLVTTVVGNLEQGITPAEAVQRCFPPGSMTGAPKLRSVQILDELEGHRPRGAYSGTLGYISLDGSLDLSVVIRTMVIRGDDVSIGGGGAITWLSDPDSEWEEVLTKVGSVTR